MKMPPGWKQDDSVKRNLSAREKISNLESKRDFLIDHGFLNRAKALENQIRALKNKMGF